MLSRIQINCPPSYYQSARWPMAIYVSSDMSWYTVTHTTGANKSKSSQLSY